MAAIIKTIITKTKYKTTGKEFVSSYSELNSNGGNAFRKEFNEDGTLKGRIKYFYNKNARITSEEYTFPDGRTLMKAYFYMDDSMMVRTVNEFEEETERIVFKYNENHQVVSRTEYNQAGIKIKETEYFYNGGGLLIKQKDTQGGETVYEYDMENREIKRVYTDSFGTVLDGVVTFYDSSGRVVREESGGEIKTIEYNY